MAEGKDGSSPRTWSMRAEAARSCSMERWREVAAEEGKGRRSVKAELCEGSCEKGIVPSGGGGIALLLAILVRSRVTCSSLRSANL